MEPALVSIAAGVQRVTLNRPEKLNAFNPAMHKALAAAMDRAETDPGIRCLLITGAGRGFCAGQDLTERDLQREIGKGEDYREGVSAFLEKRKPHFTGR